MSMPWSTIYYIHEFGIRVHYDSPPRPPIGFTGPSSQLPHSEASVGYLCRGDLAFPIGGECQKRRPGTFRWYVNNDRKEWVGITGMSDKH